MIDLQINELFARYFGELDYGQLIQLEKSMLADLTSEPILWWHNEARDRDELLDGHNRYAIAKKHKLDVQFHEKHFASEDEALLFVIRTQTTRRNIVNRENVLKRAVELEIKLGKSKSQAIQDTALLTNVSERTVWRSVEEKTPVQQFFEARKLYERDLERVCNKEIEKLKQRAIKEGYAEDEDRLASEWESIETEIADQFAAQTSELQSEAEAIALEQEASGKRVSVGGKRRGSKSGTDKAVRRNAMKKALSLIAQLQNDVLYFWDKTVGIEADDLRAMLKLFTERVRAEQEADKLAAKRKKFGR